MLRAVKTAFLVLTILSAVLIHLPLHDFILSLSQGDHGRDFYAFGRTALGETPYRDFFWNYGPLMPYFYALFMKLFGATIASVLLGDIFLKIVSTGLFFISLCLFIEAPMALLGAVWFCAFNPNFFHTYNHVGAITMMFLTLYLIFKYIQKPAPQWIYFMLLPLLAVFLIKINMGISTLAATGISLWIIDTSQKVSFSKKIAHLALVSLVLPATIIIYALFLQGLPQYYISQCLVLPFKDAIVYELTFFSRLIKVILLIFLSPHTTYSILLKNLKFYMVYWPALTLVLLLMGSISVVYWKKAVKNESVPRKSLWLAILVIILFCAFNLHEYFLSNGNYKFYWATPFLFLLFFLIAGVVIRRLRLPLKIIIFLILTATIFLNDNLNYLAKERMVKGRNFLFLQHENARIYVNNPLEWILTVQQTTRYLAQNLRPDESFLALPIDPLFYFLMGKKSPVPEIFFSLEVHIIEEQELRIIKDLENQQLPYIVYSNRCLGDPNDNLGRFGHTHCRLLANYLASHYTEVERFGDWSKPGEWASNYAVIIFKRRI